MHTNSVRIYRGVITTTQTLAKNHVAPTLEIQQQYILSKSRSFLSAVRGYHYCSQRISSTLPVCLSFSSKNLNNSNLNISTRNFAKMAQLKSFQEHEIVPDVIDVAPTELVTVKYGQLEVKEGGVLTPTQVQNKPQLEWKADANAFYTVCMTDPDAPSRKDPTFREWHHWLVVNIPGINIEQGEVLSDYIGSGPPKDTGLHRYIFLVYKQPSKLTFDENRLPDNSGDGRGCFKIAAFAKKYKLGNPVAGNFYQAEYDDYVPKLYAKLGA